jgi:RND family efflux transporter MFP subunit
MTRPLRLIVNVLILAVILAATGFGYRALSRLSKQSKAPTAALKSIPVRAAAVSRATLSQSLVLSGNIEPILQVDLKPKIAGRLERLGGEQGGAIEEGTPVKAGDVVAVLEHRDLDAQAAAAAAAVATAEAGIQAAQAAHADTQRERKRAENLLAQGSATEQARDRAATADDRAAAAVAQAKAQADQARAALLSAEVLRAEAVLRAPFDGVVAAKYADPGALVTPSTPLLRIVSGELRILAAVPTRHLPALASGRATAAISVDVWPDRLFPADIRTVFPEVNEATRTATVELRVPAAPAGGNNPPLKPGMYATLRIVLETRENVLAVPADAVIRVRERNLVYLARDDGKAESRDVALGLREAERVEIVDGLKEGDRIVVSGQQRLTDGASIEIRDTPQAPAAAPEATP